MLLGCLSSLVLLLIVLVGADVVRIYSYLLFWLLLMFYCWMLVLMFLGVLMCCYCCSFGGGLIVFGWGLLECAGGVGSVCRFAVIALVNWLWIDYYLLICWYYCVTGLHAVLVMLWWVVVLRAFSRSVLVVYFVGCVWWYFAWCGGLFAGVA